MATSSSFANRKPTTPAEAVADAFDPKAKIAVQATIAYPTLTAPDEQSGAYQALFIIPPTGEDYENLKALVAANAMATFKTPTLPPRAFNPLRSGDEPSARGDGYAFKAEPFRGQMVFRAKTKFQPAVYWGPGREKVDASELRGGDHVLVEISAYGYNNQSLGVAFSLGDIWIIRRGKVLIERGAGGSASLAKYDTSRLNFGLSQSGGDLD